jgi:hypothetical protein
MLINVTNVKYSKFIIYVGKPISKLQMDIEQYGDANKTNETLRIF